MTVRVVEDGTIRLEGHCSVEDAEQLLIALHGRERGILDISRLSRAHLAVAQILAAAQPILIGTPENDFVREMVVGALGGPAQKDAGPRHAGR